MDEVIEQVAPEAVPEQTATPELATETNQEETPPPAERTFTQKELDEIISKRIAKESAKAERRALKVYADKLEKMTQPQVASTPQPKPDGKPVLAQFQNVEDYVEAVSDWKLNQRDQSAKAQQQEQQARTIADKAQSIFQEAEKIPGFDREVFDSLPVSDAMAWAIMDGEAPAKLMAHLTENPAEVLRIINLPPARQAAEIGKLETKIASAKPVSVSKAPEPITPIGTRGTSNKDPSDMSDAEFATWRKRQIAQRR